jgi:hypothetical protein
MGGALQGIGSPSVYPQSTPWGWAPQFGGQTGGQFGTHVPQQLQTLQAAFYQLLQVEGLQLQHKLQQIQQLAQIIPQQLQQIQYLTQFVAQQASHQSPLHASQPFLPNTSQYLSSFGTPPGWLGTFPTPQPQMFGGQGGFGGQSGYVM